jgi:amidohydrolase
MKKPDRTLARAYRHAIREADALRPQMVAMSRFIHAHPELGEQEFKCSRHLADELRRYGFRIEMPVGGMPTAFRATVKGRRAGPTVAFLAEYDALPEVAHGCGHNFIGTASAFAAIVLSDLMASLNGRILVIGTPAEETIGGKITLLDAGVFADVDVALMVHPSTETRIYYTSLAAQIAEIEFRGKPSHAAASPWLGINALDALVQTYVAIDNLKKQLSPSVRIPGIITHGGVRPNIVPERATGLFSVRAESSAALAEVIKKVRACAKGAALATGARLAFRMTDRRYDEMRTNRTLAALFEKHWCDLGGRVCPSSLKGRGSVDIGNLSHVLPAIHPSIAITEPQTPGHSREFARASISQRANRELLRVVKTLALTALDIISQKQLLAKVKAEFRRTSSGK